MNNGISIKHDTPCTRVVDHESRIGALEKGVEVLEEQASTLFKQAQQAFDKVQDVGRKVDKVHYSLENGLSRDIKELCEMSRKQHQMIEENREQRERTIKSLEERIRPLEESAWIPKIINMGVHKAFFWVIVVLAIMALTQTIMWGVAKTYIFKEAPGQSMSQFEALDKNHVVDKKILPAQ